MGLVMTLDARRMLARLLRMTVAVVSTVVNCGLSVWCVGQVMASFRRGTIKTHILNTPLEYLLLPIAHNVPKLCHFAICSKDGFHKTPCTQPHCCKCGEE